MRLPYILFYKPPPPLPKVNFAINISYPYGFAQTETDIDCTARGDELYLIIKIEKNKQIMNIKT